MNDWKMNKYVVDQIIWLCSVAQNELDFGEANKKNTM